MPKLDFTGVLNDDLDPPNIDVNVKADAESPIEGWMEKAFNVYKEVIMSGNMETTQKLLIAEGVDKQRREYQALLGVDIVLRGISQVFLCNHPVTGILVCAGLAVTSANLMWYALLGTTIATLSAATLGRPPIEDIYAGLCGYDGALVGCACWAFMPATYSLQAAFLLPVLTGLVHVAFVHFLRTWQLPSFTFAFNVVTIMFMYASSNGVIKLELNNSPPTPHDADWNDMSVQYVVDASIRGVGQFMFADTTVGSALVIAGICISSRKGSLVAVIGAVTGWVVSRYILQASDVDNIRAGLFGYNAAGTCSALSGGIFYKTSDGALLIGIVGAMLSALLNVGFAGLLDGLPVLTFPFIVATWIIMLSRTRWLTEADQIVRPLIQRMSSRRTDAHNQLVSLRMFRSLRSLKSFRSSSKRGLNTTTSGSAVPVRQASTQATPVRQVSNQVTHVRQVSTQETPVRQISNQVTHVRQVSTQETPVRQISTQVTHVRQVSTQETPVRQISTQVTHVRQVSTQETPVRQTSQQTGTITTPPRAVECDVPEEHKDSQPIHAMEITLT